MSKTKVQYVCKYTPLEILAGFDCEWELIDQLAGAFDLAGRLSQDYLCGFGKSRLQTVLQ